LPGRGKIVTWRNLAAPAAHLTEKVSAPEVVPRRARLAQARLAVASSRLLVHDSQYDLFVFTLDIEEQVRK